LALAHLDRLSDLFHLSQRASTPLLLGAYKGMRRVVFFGTCQDPMARPGQLDQVRPALPGVSAFDPFHGPAFRTKSLALVIAFADGKPINVIKPSILE